MILALTGSLVIALGAIATLEAADNAPKNRPSLSKADASQAGAQAASQSVENSEPRRLILGAGVCPGGTCTSGVGCNLTQNLNTTYDGQNTVACGVGSLGQTTANAWARCFHRADEGMAFTTAYTIQSVTFGLQQLSFNCEDQQDCDDNGGGICGPCPDTTSTLLCCNGSSRTANMQVRVYADNNQCPPVNPTALGGDSTEICRKDFTVSQADLSTPIICVPTPLACPGGTDAECQNLAVPDAVCNANFCETVDGDPLSADCFALGGSTCGIEDPAECDNLSTLNPITIQFDDGTEPVLTGGRDLVVEILSLDDGTDNTLNFALRMSSNFFGQCGDSYLRGPDGECGSTQWDPLQDVGADFADTHHYMEVEVTEGGTPAICGNGVIQNCEECDPPTFPVGCVANSMPGQVVCDCNCRLVGPGHPLAADCCDVGNADNNVAPGCQDYACWEEVCAIDAFCCDEIWDSGCAGVAIFECAGVGEICEVTTALQTYADVAQDGYLRVAVESTGAWASITFSGQGDNYNPAGDLEVAEACFSNYFWLFRPATQDRGAISLNPDILGVYPIDTETLSVTETAPIERSDELYGDGVEDTATSAFDITSNTLGSDLDLSVSVFHQVHRGDGWEEGSAVAYITQEYTFVNNSPNPVDFNLVRTWDADLVWDPDADYTDDIVGTGANGTDCDLFVYQREDGDLGTSVTMSSPDAVAYFGSKGGIRSDGITLDGAQAGTASAGSGSGTVSLDPDTNELCWDIDYEGLGSNTTAAHFHGPDGFPGDTAAPVVPPVPLVLVPAAATAGSISGCQEISDQAATPQTTEVNNGEWYVNIHTTGAAAGEIRGQVGPAYGFGTDLQEWQQYGIPNNWVNNIAGVGYSTNGESGVCIGPGCDEDPPAPTLCDPCDGHIGLEIPVSLAGSSFAGSSKVITIVHTYGAPTPYGLPCKKVGGGCGLCAADIDNDGMGNGSVGASDLAQVLGGWGNPGCAPCCADITEDGKVDAADLAQVLGHWGPCP